MKPRILIPALLASAGLVTAGCGGASDSTDDSASAQPASKGGTQLSLVAYSTPEVVYDEVIPKFQKTEAGAGVSFKSSYGASGDQSRAVEAGQKADYVAFSLDETEMGFAFPKEERAALVAAQPHRFHLPQPSDLRFNWVEADLAALSPAEAREFVVDAWRMVVPKKLSRAYDLAHPDGPG